MVNPEDPGYPFPYTAFTGPQPVVVSHSVIVPGMSATMPPPAQGRLWLLNHNTPPPGTDREEKSKRSKDFEDFKAFFIEEREELKIAREHGRQEAMNKIAEQEEKRRRENEIAEAFTKGREEAEKAAKDAADREELKKRLKEAEADKEEAVTKLEIAMEAKNKPAPDVGETPIKFKAAGREYPIPFHLCKPWEAMEELLRSDDVIRGQLNQGQYDLMGPDGRIILPLVWESTIQPGWEVSLQLRREPEEAKERAKPASSRKTAGSSRRSRSTRSHAKHRQRKYSCAVM